MSEDRVERAIEEHGHVLRKATKSAHTVHLPAPGDPHGDAACYATDGIPTRVLESSAQVPLGATLCKLCRGAETGAETATNTAEAVREMAREHPEQVHALLEESEREQGDPRV